MIGITQQNPKLYNLPCTYYLYRPWQSSSSQPLLIGLHGGQTSATRFAETTEFNALAAKR